MREEKKVFEKCISGRWIWCFGTVDRCMWTSMRVEGSDCSFIYSVGREVLLCSLRPSPNALGRGG